MNLYYRLRRTPVQERSRISLENLYSLKILADHVHAVSSRKVADEPLVELETDKVTVEVPAPASGKLLAIDAVAGSTVNVGALLGSIEEGAAGGAASR